MLLAIRRKKHFLCTTSNVDAARTCERMSDKLVIQRDNNGILNDCSDGVSENFIFTGCNYRETIESDGVCSNDEHPMVVDGEILKFFLCF